MSNNKAAWIEFLKKTYGKEVFERPAQIKKAFNIDVQKSTVSEVLRIACSHPLLISELADYQELAETIIRDFNEAINS